MWGAARERKRRREMIAYAHSLGWREVPRTDVVPRPVATVRDSGRARLTLTTVRGGHYLSVPTWHTVDNLLVNAYPRAPNHRNTMLVSKPPGWRG